MAKPAVKALAALPLKDQRLVDARVAGLATDPRPHPASIELKGATKGLRRVRQGDHRILYTVDDEQRLVVILDIKNRREAYR